MKRPKTGCLTCRIRKVKCDEAKPSCQKCKSTGRTCDGYSTLPFSRNDLLAASQRSKTPPSLNACREASSSLGARLVTNEVFSDVAEKRYFQFFRICTVASTNVTVDSRFWDSLILQSYHAEPAIKHAVLTLASYHNYVITRDNRDLSQQHLAYADQQYQRALSEAKQLIATPSSKYIDRILMVCVLFITFENLRGNYAASRKHMDAGRTIAAQYWKAGQKPSKQGRSREIAEVFARLDLFALSFSDAAAPYEYTLDDLYRTGPELQPSPFASVHEAHVSLMDLVRWLLVTGDQMISKCNGLDPAMPHFEVELSQCQQRLIEWKSYWDDVLLRTRPTRNVDVLLIEMWYIKAIALAQSGFIGAESRYDSSMLHFERIISLGEEVATAISQTPDLSAFSLDLGYLAIAFFCAIRCRDPSLRRRAIQVLESHPRREGMWESTAAGAIARRWMELEEAGLGEINSAESVPESKRIAILDLEVNSAASSAALRFTASSSASRNDQVCRDEKLEWSRLKPFGQQYSASKNWNT